MKDKAGIKQKHAVHGSMDEGARRESFFSVHPLLYRLFKLPGVLVLLIYEDIIILAWPGGPCSDIPALLVIIAADIAIGFDVFIRPGIENIKEKDHYATWKIMLFFIASPVFLGAPWIERALLARLYQGEALLFVLLAVGSAMTLAGGILLGWARLTLGKFGTPKIFLQEGHLLVTKGPYRWLRNPMYFADLLLYCGVAIALGAWVSCAFAIAALLPMLLGRIRTEERLLEERFGDEYRAWADRTWRLIPFL